MIYSPTGEVYRLPGEIGKGEFLETFNKADGSRAAPSD
jgi:hypothetical protein